MLDRFGKAVRAVRFIENILLYDMAKAMNLESAELSGIECGRKPIPDWFIPKLVEKYESAKDMEALLQKYAKARINTELWCEERGRALDCVRTIGKEGLRNVSNNRYNSEGYSDPTAYAALNKIDKEAYRLKQIRQVLGEVCALSGYQLKGQITLIDKRTGHTVRL